MKINFIPDADPEFIYLQFTDVHSCNVNISGNSTGVILHIPRAQFVDAFTERFPLAKLSLPEPKCP